MYRKVVKEKNLSNSMLVTLMFPVLFKNIIKLFESKTIGSGA